MAKRFKVTDKLLVIDADSEIYAAAFGCQRKEHFAHSKNGTLLFSSTDKRKYNKWFKESGFEVDDIEYTMTEDLLPLSIGKANIDKFVKSLMELSSATRNVLLLTKGGRCFRTALATIRKYKGNRDSMVKPEYYEPLRKYMIDKYKAKVYVKWEADDVCCMILEKDRLNPEEGKQVILAAIDKDLAQQTGRHCNPNKPEQGVFTVDEFEGQYAFYKQMLMGDTADNIPGLKGYGDAKATKVLDGCKTVPDLCDAVAREYLKVFGTEHEFTPWWWDAQYCEGGKYEDDKLALANQEKYPYKTRTVSWVYMFRENANLLYMLRSPTDQYKPHVAGETLVDLCEWTPYKNGTVKQFLGD